MRTDAFSRLVDEFDALVLVALVAKQGDEKLAAELVGRFSAVMRGLRPSPVMHGETPAVLQ